MTTESADIGLHGPDNVQEKYTSKYLDLDLGPQFAFGHGSGYAAFSHSVPRLSAATISAAALDAGDAVTLEIDVTNTSSRDGDEVVQVYVEDLVASVAPPVRRLIAFSRIRIAAGATSAVSFTIGSEQLAFWHTRGAAAEFAVEPGRFVLHVGSTLASTQPVDLEVTEERL